MCQTSQHVVAVRSIDVNPFQVLVIIDKTHCHFMKYMHAQTHAYYAYVCTLLYTHTHMHACTHSYMHTHTHTHTHTCTHACTRTYTHTHTHTHTHRFGIVLLTG